MLLSIDILSYVKEHNDNKNKQTFQETKTLKMEMKICQNW